MDAHKLNFSQTIEALQKKEVSAQDLATAYLDHIEKTDGDLNTLITFTKEEALSQAKEVDAKRAAGEELGPLAGIPLTVKDVLSTKGIRTTACSKILDQYVPAHDATAYKRLRDAGMILLGKSNCDEFAHGASTENSAYGVSHNPWDLTRVPGGSSGGSAANVAAKQALASIGTDTGGSIRQPAGFCGISALKPTYGRISRYGLIAMTSSTDVVAPMSHDVTGLAHLMEAMSGKDPLDATSLDKPVPRYAQELSKANLKGKVIGLPKEYFTDDILPQVRQRVDEAIDVFKSMGAEVKEISLPHSSMAVAVYYIVTPSEVSSNLARFDGIRYGYSVSTDAAHAQEIKSLTDVYTKSRRYGLGDEAKRRIMLGTYALSSGYYDAYYKKASKVRTLIRRDFDEAFTGVDLILTPVSPKVAFKIGEQKNNPLQMYLEDVFVAPASLAGLPALAVPCGFAQADDDDTMQLPVGLQLIAPQFEETRLLQAGYLYQTQTSWHEQMPKIAQ